MDFCLFLFALICTVRYKIVCRNSNVNKFSYIQTKNNFASELSLDFFHHFDSKKIKSILSISKFAVNHGWCLVSLKKRKNEIVLKQNA